MTSWPSGTVFEHIWYKRTPATTCRRGSGGNGMSVHPGRSNDIGAGRNVPADEAVAEASLQLVGHFVEELLVGRFTSVCLDVLKADPHLVLRALANMKVEVVTPVLLRLPPALSEPLEVEHVDCVVEFPHAACDIFTQNHHNHFWSPKRNGKVQPYAVLF